MNLAAIRKIFVHILLFFSCLAVAGGMFLVQSYTMSYTRAGLICTSYQETEDFEKHFYKYVERTAAYTSLRSFGYAPDETISHIRGRAIHGSDYKAFPTDTEQAQLEFYNRKLNGVKTGFLYYVEGFSTELEDVSSPESSFVSPQLKRLCRQAGTGYVEQLTEMINGGAPYFILYGNGIYNTNLETYGYLTDSVRSYVEKCLDGRALYAVSTCEFEGCQDDFADGYEDFARRYSQYRFGRQASVVGIFAALISFGAALYLCGHAASQLPVTAPVPDSPEALRKYRRSRIRLLGIDRIPIELSVILAVFLWLIPCNYLMNEILAPYLAALLPETPQANLWFVLSFTVSYLIFVPLFFSGVRRIKAGTILTQSLTVRTGRKIIHWIRRFFENRSITLQAGILLGLFLLGGIAACLLCSFYGGDPERLPLLLIGLALFLVLFFFLALHILRTCADLNIVMKETEELQNGSFEHKIPDTLHSVPARTLGQYINNIGDGLQTAVDQQVKSERLKTALITNVSHDIKTPLTSIINYVDLLKRMDLNNEKANGYLDILNNKSWRLKNLIEDLVEASKASSGAISLQCEKINFVELIRQSCAEYEDRFLARKLSMITGLPDHPVYIFADGRRTFRIVENLLSNASKYALSGTRVYIDLTEEEGRISLAIKNISATQLNISAEELMERFVRGDQSRSTEGSGLGLSIAESLAKLQGADFRLELDGDLFKAVLTFPVLQESQK